MISMQKLLDSELHAYADIATIGDRVVAVVPEVSGVEYVQLLHRLATKAVTQLGGEIRIGLARYPRDAVCAAELVEAADRDRLARGFALISGDGKSVAKRQVSP